MQYILSEEEYAALTRTQEGIKDFQMAYNVLVAAIVVGAKSVIATGDMSNKEWEVRTVISKSKLPKDAVTELLRRLSLGDAS